MHVLGQMEGYQSIAAIGFLIVVISTASFLLWRGKTRSGRRKLPGKSPNEKPEAGVAEKNGGGKIRKRNSLGSVEKTPPSSRPSTPSSEEEKEADATKEDDLKQGTNENKDLPNNAKKPGKQGNRSPRLSTRAKELKIQTSSSRISWFFYSLGLPKSSLYHHVKKYVLGERDLIFYGYPVAEDGEKFRIHAKGVPPEVKTEDGNFVRRCCRCRTDYKVKPNGEVVTSEICFYHWGKIPFEGAQVYSCCSGDRCSSPCSSYRTHVNIGTANQDGYVVTRRRKCEQPGGDYGIFALDCEMCFTTQGLEVTKVSLVDPTGKVLYNTFIKPLNPIIDYNTRFSGVTAQDLKNVHVILPDVQHELRKRISEETILIGHGLECDLKALKIVHNTVVDTSVIFPHPWGGSYRSALRTLVQNHLEREVQDSQNGHCSVEDAQSSLELILWRVKQDLTQSSREL